MFLYEHINNTWGDIANSLILIFQFFRMKMILGKSVLQKLWKLFFSIPYLSSFQLGAVCLYYWEHIWLRSSVI